MDAPMGHRLEQDFKRGFRLEALRIDPATGEVTGPGGREQLDPKVMDVLVFMAVHANRVVTRDELFARLWPNAVVTDDALTRCFSELRRQLSAAGGDERYRAMFETLPKRGYRLNAQAELLAQPSAPKLRRMKRVAAAAGLAVLAVVLILVLALRPQPGTDAAAPMSPVRPSIAVLPFADMSERQDQGYFGDGVAEEILNRLAKAGDLRVISRTSSFSFRDQTAQIPEIARQLDVTHLLEGSVRRSGERVRITAQLIAASDNSHVWSETFDRGRGDLFAIQDEIAAAVATALQVRLSGGKAHEGMPASVEAHEYFLRGNFLYARRAPGDMALAAEHYEKAVALDPAYVRAWAALAGASSILADQSGPREAVHRERQEFAARKAFELDPRSAESHMRMAQMYFMKQDFDRAHYHEHAAFALDPDDRLVLAMMSVHAFWKGLTGDAIAFERRVVARDPLSIPHRRNLALMLAADGQYDAALSEYARVLEISPGPDADTSLEIVRILVLQERYDEARPAANRLPDGRLRDHGIALLHAVPALKEEADAALSRLASVGAAAPSSFDEAVGQLMDVIRLAEVHVHRGSVDEAFAVLHRKSSVLDRGGRDTLALRWRFRTELRRSPFFRPHRSDPRWVAHLADPA